MLNLVLETSTPDLLLVNLFLEETTVITRRVPGKLEDHGTCEKLCRINRTNKKKRSIERGRRL